jgi:hypothetical protein
VPQVRERFANKPFLANLEAAARRHESWIESRSPGHVAAMRHLVVGRHQSTVGRS